MPFVVKAALDPKTAGKELTFVEKTMYGGKTIRPDDEIFIFASDHDGGRGLWARGVVTSVERGPNIRLTIAVRRVALARRPLGRGELKAYRELTDDRPETEIARKLYRQATNKIAGFPTGRRRFWPGTSRRFAQPEAAGDPFRRHRHRCGAGSGLPVLLRYGAPLPRVASRPRALPMGRRPRRQGRQRLLFRGRIAGKLLKKQVVFTHIAPGRHIEFAQRARAHAGRGREPEAPVEQACPPDSPADGRQGRNLSKNSCVGQAAARRPPHLIRADFKLTKRPLRDGELP